MKRAYFEKRLACAAPKGWSKYTTFSPLNNIFLLVPVIVFITYGWGWVWGSGSICLLGKASQVIWNKLFSFCKEVNIMGKVVFRKPPWVCRLA